MVVEAESKYSLFNLSTFAEKETTRQKLSIKYTLCKCFAKFLPVGKTVLCTFPMALTGRKFVYGRELVKLLIISFILLTLMFNPGVVL